MINCLQLVLSVVNLKIVPKQFLLFTRAALTITANISYSVFRAHHHPSPLCYNEDWLCNLFALFAYSGCLLNLVFCRKNTAGRGKKSKIGKTEAFSETRHGFHLVSSALFCLAFTIQCTPAKCNVIVTMNKCCAILTLDCFVLNVFNMKLLRLKMCYSHCRDWKV